MVDLGIVRGARAAQALAWFVLDPVKCLEYFQERYGRVVRIERKRKQPILVLTGPTYNREVLMATDRLRPTGVWPVRAPEGSAQANLRRNYLTTHGDAHKQFADTIAPHLDRGEVETYFEPVRKIAVAEIDAWPIGERLDIYERFRLLAQRYAFEILYQISDGEKSRAFGARLAEYHVANWSPMACIVRLNLPFLPYRNVLRRAEELQSLALDLLPGARQCPMHKNVPLSLASVEESGAASPAVRTAAQICGFALASYETTSTTLTWALVLLSQHPPVMAALASEIAGAGPVEDISGERLAELPLLDAVLKETMRLITPVPILGFKTIRNCTIAGFCLSEGTTVMISPHLTHRLPELYEQPDRFLPERWSKNRPTTYEYLPFSGGPRRCPGYLFAMANMRVALAVLLSRYHVELIDGARINRTYAAVSLPRGSVPAMLMPRSHAPSPLRAPRRQGSVFDLFSPAAQAGV